VARLARQVLTAPVVALVNCSSVPTVYRRRQPEETDLHKAVAQNLAPFIEGYDEHFLASQGPLTRTQKKALEGFVSCGLLSQGFARALCSSCGAGMLVAFSCQLRGVCPSCQQKRAELLCRFVSEELIEPAPHRQLVFVMPRRLRQNFHQDPELLRGLCRAAVDATTAFYRALLGRDDVKVGMTVVPQSFGDRGNAHLHLHALVTDGAFAPDGTFYGMPFDGAGDSEVLTKLFAKNVLDLCIAHQRMSVRHRDEMLTWQHTGFSVDGSVKIAAGDRAGLLRLVRYIARPAVSFERVGYDASTGKVTVRSAKKRGGVRPVVATYHVLTFLALLVLHVPPARMHMVRYFGWYASRSRALRKACSDSAAGEVGQGGQAPEGLCTAPTPAAKERRLRWAQLVKLVFEVDPLQCDRCGGQMKPVAFITPSQPAVIERILTHLGLQSDEATTRKTGPPLWLQIAQAQSYLAEHPECSPDWDGSRDELEHEANDPRGSFGDAAHHDQRNWG